MKTLRSMTISYSIVRGQKQHVKISDNIMINSKNKCRIVKTRVALRMCSRN